MMLDSPELSNANADDDLRVQPIKISIIVPVYNEASVIVQTLKPLQIWRERGLEVIVVDGGSRDQTANLAEPWVDHYLYSSPGRAQQMNAGATKASGDCLMFLHADTLLPAHFFETLIDVLHGSMQWGFFPVRLSGRHWLLRWVERGMNLRSRLTSVATGDQAIWLSRSLWRRLEGFKCIALMEDIELSKRMRKVVKPHVASQPLCTSSRRWESQGVVSTILLMWRLRFMYFVGICPSVLVRRYRHQNMR